MSACKIHRQNQQINLILNSTSSITLTAAPTPKPTPFVAIVEPTDPTKTFRPKPFIKIQTPSSSPKQLKTIKQTRPKTKTQSKPKTTATKAHKTYKEYPKLSKVDLLALLLWHEARGESDKCQIAIAQLVLNRANGGDIEQTILAKNQFSPTRNLAYFFSKKPTSKEIRNAKAALNGKKVVKERILYFHSTSIGKKAWAKKHKYITTIDKTSFYAR